MAAQANYSAPEQDIGYEQVTVASISFEGQAFVSFDNTFNVVEWQTPQVLSQVSDMSAQVIDVFEINNSSVVLVRYRWPIEKSPKNYSNYTSYSNEVRKAPIRYFFGQSGQSFT